MATETSDRYKSDLAVLPGELIAEELETRGMTRLDLATLTGRSPQTISRLIVGRAALTADTAIDLEGALGVSAAFGLRLEASYRLTLARQKLPAQSRDRPLGANAG